MILRMNIVIHYIAMCLQWVEGGDWDEVIQIGRLVEQEIIEPEEAIIPDFVHTPYGGEKNEPKYDVTPELGMLLFQAAV
jgi:hypothetical protein